MLPVRQVSCVTERCIRQGLDLPIALFLIGLTPVLMPAHTNELCNFIIISSVQQTPQNKKLTQSHGPYDMKSDHSGDLLLVLHNIFMH